MTSRVRAVRENGSYSVYTHATMPHFVFGSLFIWPKLSHNVIVKQLKNVMFLIFV